MSLNDLGDYEIIEILERIDDETLYSICIPPVNKRLQKICKMNGNIRNKIDFMINLIYLGDEDNNVKITNEGIIFSGTSYGSRNHKDIKLKKNKLNFQQFVNPPHKSFIRSNTSYLEVFFDDNKIIVQNDSYVIFNIPCSQLYFKLFCKNAKRLLDRKIVVR